jgi:hypothetical protein
MRKAQILFRKTQEYLARGRGEFNMRMDLRETGCVMESTASRERL